MRKASILAAALLLTPALSQAKTLEELLVEKGVITKGEAMSAAPSAMQQGKVYYNKGTTFEFPDAGFTSKINVLLQNRYQYTDNDNDSGERDTSSFDVVRARLVVSGTALHDEFAYKIEPDFVGNHEGSQKVSEVKDAWVAWNNCDWSKIMIGQFKTMYGRQELANDYALQHPDRTLVSDYMAFGRQPGLAGQASLMGGKLVLDAGIFNGTSTGESVNASGNFTGNARNTSGVDNRELGIIHAQWNAMGKMDTKEEGDIDYTEELALTIGGAYAHNKANIISDDAGDVSTRNNRAAADVNAKYRGLGAHLEVFNDAYKNEDTKAKAEPTGGYAQVGYFLKPKVFEIAGRYGILDCDDGKAAGICSGLDKVNEAGASLNYHWWRHQLKGQLAYTLVNKDLPGDGSDGDTNENRWMFQLTAYL